MKCINKKLVKVVVLRLPVASAHVGVGIVQVKSALENVLEERNVLTLMKSTFVTNLKYAMQDEETLYLV